MVFITTMHENKRHKKIHFLSAVLHRKNILSSSCQFLCQE